MQLVDYKRLKACIGMRIPPADFFGHDCTQLLAEDVQAQICKDVQPIIESNPYYARTFLRHYLKELEKSGPIDDIYELFCSPQVLGARELAPTEADTLEYPIDNVGNTVRIREKPKIISGAGTTGLRTWEAAVFLVQYLLNGSDGDQFGDKLGDQLGDHPGDHRRELGDHTGDQLGDHPGELGDHPRDHSGDHHRELGDHPTDHPKNKLCHKRILELGAGTALVSLAIAKQRKSVGYMQVTVTDGDTELLGRVPATFADNGMEDMAACGVRVEQLVWGDEFGGGDIAPDIVVAADVTYDGSIVGQLCDTLEGFLRAGTEQCLIAATVRNPSTIETWEHELGRFRWSIAASLSDPHNSEGSWWFRRGTPEIRIYRIQL